MSHEVWTADETKFLISSMGQHFADMNNRPKSIAELDRKVRLGRGQKKAL